MWAILAGHGWLFDLGVATYCLAGITFIPTLVRYRRPWVWVFALPLIALFYMAATLSSALDYWRGRGARWKRRAYGA